MQNLQEPVNLDERRALKSLHTAVARHSSNERVCERFAAVISYALKLIRTGVKAVDVVERLEVAVVLADPALKDKEETQDQMLERLEGEGEDDAAAFGDAVATKVRAARSESELSASLRLLQPCPQVNEDKSIEQRVAKLEVIASALPPTPERALIAVLMRDRAVEIQEELDPLLVELCTMAKDSDNWDSFRAAREHVEEIATIVAWIRQDARDLEVQEWAPLGWAK